MLAGGPIHRIALIAAALGAFGLVTGCGPGIPEHDGYRSKRSKPWKKPKKLKFDEDNEATADHNVDYAKRRRSRWYRVDLPGDGELQIKFEVSPPGDKEDDEDFDIAFEVLNDKYKAIATANKDDDDAGETSKTRTLYELRQGQYFIHVYAQGRLDKADFTLKVKYSKATLERESDFPKNVDFPPKLAVVPAFDDAPKVDCERCSCKSKLCKANCPKKCRVVNCRKCNCRRSCKWSCKRKCGIKTTRPKTPKPTNGTTTKPAGKATSARIVRMTKSSGGGTNLILNRGSNHGVAKGWRGSISGVSRSGFTVSSVSATECRATVAGATPDAIRKSKLRAYLRPPK